MEKVDNYLQQKEAFDLIDVLIKIKLREDRLTMLLSLFENRYTDEWFFSLPESFRLPLDIKWTARKVEKKNTKILTQGSAFSFKIGDTIYDTTNAYLVWNEALQYIEYMIEVIYAKNAIPIGTKELFRIDIPFIEKALKPEKISELIPVFEEKKFPIVPTAIIKQYPQKKDKWTITDDKFVFFPDVPKELDGYLIAKIKIKKDQKEKEGKEEKEEKKYELAIYKWVKRDPGTVTFTISFPNEKRDSIEEIERHTLNQDDFVRFLIMGPKFLEKPSRKFPEKQDKLCQATLF